MHTIKTEQSRIVTAADELLDGRLTIVPSAEFDFTEEGVRRKVGAERIVAEVAEGLLTEPLVLAPTRGAEHDRANIVYRVTYQMRRDAKASRTWVELWDIPADSPAEIELTDVTRVSVAGLPAYVALSGDQAADLAAATAARHGHPNKAALDSIDTDFDLTIDGMSGTVRGSIAQGGAIALPFAMTRGYIVKGDANGYGAVFALVDDAGAIRAFLSSDGVWVADGQSFKVAANVDGSKQIASRDSDGNVIVGNPGGGLGFVSESGGLSLDDMIAAQADATQALADAATAQTTADAAVVGGNGIDAIVALTQAEYDALSPDPSTLYVIT